MVDKISRARKKELEQPDPFLEALYNGLEKAGKYKKQIVWIAAAVAAVVVIFAGTVYNIQKAGSSASTLLAQTLEKYSGQEPVEGYEAVKEDFNKLLEQYANTSAGRVALVRYAGICYKASKFDKAREMYEKALDQFSDDPVMHNLIQVSLGHACQAGDQYDRAEASFREVVDGDNPFLKDEALFNLGILLAVQGVEKESNTFFKTIVSDHKDSLYFPVAESRLAKS
ncbi:MAG TPA: tetratricopeptide repeat protein [Desulfobacteraceae bacterium]|nr:tetratricopeptide repeat protein [Desulfobacteraceae bacterium]